MQISVPEFFQGFSILDTVLKDVFTHNAVHSNQRYLQPIKKKKVILITLYLMGLHLNHANTCFESALFLSTKHFCELSLSNVNLLSATTENSLIEFSISFQRKAELIWLQI